MSVSFCVTAGFKWYSFDSEESIAGKHCFALFDNSDFQKVMLNLCTDFLLPGFMPARRFAYESGIRGWGQNCCLTWKVAHIVFVGRMELGICC